MRTRFIIFILSFLLCAESLYALEVPYLAGRVNDYAGILSEGTVNELEKTLADFEKSTTCQIAVLTVKSLEGESIEQYSIKVVEAWKLGQKGKDNGVLLLVAQNDRKMRIEVGYGLEEKLTDFISGRIIVNDIAPSFKKSDYDGGITNGINSIMKTISSGVYTSSTDSVSAAPDVESEKSENDIDRQVNDIPVTTRILIGFFIFGVLGIFTFLMIFVRGFQGIFMYFFLIPFWAMFPIMVVGVKFNFIILGIYLVGTPAFKIFLKKTKKGKKLSKKFNMFSSSGSSSSSYRSSGSSGGFSSSSSGFSGGGGSFGGGGSSGSW